MASLLSWLVCALMLVFVAGSAEEASELMSHLTAHFRMSLQECRQETGLSSETIEEFHHIWREDFDVVHRELQLLQEYAKLHHGNMHIYIKSFPQVEAHSAIIVDLIHACEKQFDGIEDNCSRVVKIVSCIKRQASEAGIAPDITMIEALLEKYA